MVFGIIIFVAVLVVVLLFSKVFGASNFESINSIKGDITIYKSLTCGCCDVYSIYVKGKVSPDVKIVDTKGSDEVKRQYGIPKNLESCHTTIIDGYFVEGHIPLEAVEKLLKERPDITGIAMPGMPTGSPGMPGTKNGDFVIYAVNKNGSYSEFMRI